MKPMQALQNRDISTIDENGCYVDVDYTVWVVHPAGVYPTPGPSDTLRKAVAEGLCYFSKEAANAHFYAVYGSTLAQVG